MSHAQFCTWNYDFPSRPICMTKTRFRRSRWMVVQGHHILILCSKSMPLDLNKFHWIARHGGLGHLQIWHSSLIYHGFVFLKPYIIYMYPMTHPLNRMDLFARFKGNQSSMSLAARCVFLVACVRWKRWLENKSNVLQTSNQRARLFPVDTDVVPNGSQRVFYIANSMCPWPHQVSVR